MTEITSEYLQEWEARLGPDKVNQAITYMRAHGWSGNTTPPPWAWAQCYAMIESGEPLPAPPYRAPESLSKMLLGFELF